jgi:hypothetical protein
MPFGKDNQLVRFAYKDTFYSHATPAPPILSSAPSQTRRSPPGPSTYTIANVPPFQNPSHRIRPHPFLEASGINWNLIENPSTITQHNQSLPNRVLYEQATIPRLPFLSITSTRIYLPWVIKVYASNGSYVTLGDVLDSIYHSMRTNITNAEFNSLHQKDQKSATRAYEQRYRRFQSTSAHNQEKRGGMKRIDFFMGRTKFCGISNTGRPDEWQLNTT